MFLPLFFKSGLSCLVVGGGNVASHKIRILLDAQCRITLVAPLISPTIAEEVKKRSLRWLDREYAAGDCAGYHLVIAATPAREINRRVSEEAIKEGIPVNVVDDPELSTVIFPAIWREESLSIAVSTGGAAPFMSAGIRTLLARYAGGLGIWVERGRRFRDTVKKEVAKTEEKNALYRRFLDVGPAVGSAAPPDGAELKDWLAWMDAMEKSGKNATD
jgi:uroporphyrin-III C-methyltransferase/precorrin-2 dehydrogenase/sirohydrochlorin ferrochelatase